MISLFLVDIDHKLKLKKSSHKSDTYDRTYVYNILSLTSIWVTHSSRNDQLSCISIKVFCKHNCYCTVSLEFLLRLVVSNENLVSLITKTMVVKIIIIFYENFSFCSRFSHKVIYSTIHRPPKFGNNIIYTISYIPQSIWKKKHVNQIINFTLCRSMGHLSSHVKVLNVWM